MSNTDYKICHVCGGKMDPQKETKTISAGNKAVEVEGVKVYLCANCGERVYPAEEIEKMEEAANHA